MMYFFKKTSLRYTAFFIMPLFCLLVILDSLFLSPVGAGDISEQQLEEALQLIKEGITQYKNSDFNNAIEQLNQGLAILEKSINQMKAKKELLNAHFHLGLAYIGTNNESAAKKQFQEVTRLEPTYTIDTTAYSRKVVSLFNEAKAEYLSQIVTEKQVPAQKSEDLEPAVTQKTEAPAEKKPLYKKWWFWTLVGVGAVGVAVAAANKEDDETEATAEDDILFQDNFNDGDLDGWIATSGAQFWRINEGQLTHLANEGSGNWWDLIETGRQDWNIGRLEVTLGGIVTPNNYEALVIFGKRGHDTFYYLYFNYGMLCFHELRNGEDIVLTSIDFQLMLNHYYDVVIEIGRSGIRVYIDELLTISEAISAPINGSIGLAASNPTLVKFDDVVVYKFQEQGAASYLRPVFRQPVSTKSGALRLFPKVTSH